MAVSPLRSPGTSCAFRPPSVVSPTGPPPALAVCSATLAAVREVRGVAMIVNTPRVPSFGIHCAMTVKSGSAMGTQPGGGQNSTPHVGKRSIGRVVAARVVAARVAAGAVAGAIAAPTERPLAKRQTAAARAVHATLENCD